jgi:hypothetical protein
MLTVRACPGGGLPMQRGASMTTSEHIDIGGEALGGVSSMEDDDEGDVPEGLVRLELEAPEIEEALAAEAIEVEAAQDIDVPDELLPEEVVEALVAERQPRWVPPSGQVRAGDGSVCLRMPRLVPPSCQARACANRGQVYLRMP